MLGVLEGTEAFLRSLNTVMVDQSSNKRRSRGVAASSNPIWSYVAAKRLWPAQKFGAREAHSRQERNCLAILLQHVVRVSAPVGNEGWIKGSNRICRWAISNARVNSPENTSAFESRQSEKLWFNASAFEKRSNGFIHLALVHKHLAELGISDRQSGSSCTALRANR